MNKNKIDALIPNAYLVLNDVGIVEDGKKIDKAWQGQIASFGASIAQGSLLAAVSFFSAKSEKTKVDDRSKLTVAMFKLLDDTDKNGSNSLFEYVEKKKKAGKEHEAKENILNIAIALKLAMNLYELGRGTKNGAESSENES